MSQSRRHTPADRTQRSTSGGFTIVEVMIVLAIAGIIMMLVFMAIPALMRSQRNSQRKEDVAYILNSVQRYQLTNSGKFPDCGGGSSPSCFGLVVDKTKISLYDTGTDTTLIITPETPLQSVTKVSNVEQIRVYNYQKCDPNNQGLATSDSAGFTDIVALYAVESGSGSTSLCQQQ